MESRRVWDDFLQASFEDVLCELSSMSCDGQNAHHGPCKASRDRHRMRDGGCARETVTWWAETNEMGRGQVEEGNSVETRSMGENWECGAEVR